MSCCVMLLDPSNSVFRPYFGLVAKNTCKTMGLCKTEPKDGFITLKTGGYLAYTRWDTIPSALVGGLVGGLGFCVVEKISDAERCAM